ncbi:MAG: Uma2 family endonuclease [Cyanobacteria bacterium P01_E01_bin.42]
MSITTERVRWTVDDLAGFPDNGNRYEIIEGELFVTRAPHWKHQDIAGAIYAELRYWSQHQGSGQAAFAPSVIFSDTDSVIPDVVWASSESLNTLLDDAGHLTGAPELVVEVLSRSASDRKRDYETKVKLYSIQGVLEYWIADRERRSLEVYRREAGQLKKVMTLYRSDRLTSPLLEEFSLASKNIFE